MEKVGLGMAAGSASGIPDSKSDYCPCNRCTLARKQGRQEVIKNVHEILLEWSVDISNSTEEKYYERIVKVLDGDKK